MKKTVLSIILFFLISCQSAPASTPTNTPVPTNTAIPITATSTIEPTFTPVPPTATSESYQEYLQTSENSFPLEGIENGLVDFVCTADFENIIFKTYQTPDGTTHRAWVACKDGGQTFITALFLHTDKLGYFATSAGASKIPPSTSFSDKFIEIKANGHVEQATGLPVGKVKVKIIGGSNSGILLKHDDIFTSIFPVVNWDEAFLEFAKTGNFTKLHKIAGIDGYLLYGVRIQLKP